MEDIKKLEIKMNEPNFWDDSNKATSIIDEVNSLKKTVERITNLKNKIESNLELLKSNDLEFVELVTSEVDEIKLELDELEIFVLLNGPYDKYNAVLEIHPGAGGTESCDWANMLYRMYTRWCEKHGYKYEIVDEQKGEEAGIKSVSMIIYGTNIFGYLKNEKGVHRLVRISPFDSNARRHTSFASVDVTPYIVNEDIDIEIKPNDIRIDVYRSTGAGGQGVNTTDSAVRITHLPTKIVVTCQNERSQIQNKEKALEILKNKLYQLEIEKKEKELKELKGEQADINFGSQIRNYVMHPYSLVKDLRTNVETSNVAKVLDGDIDIFINSCLKGIR
ncbi:MAG TPA: peptide chain release factor 2 [Candidatus Faecisoma merdavium]|nr:peptide chain release factor 2 [Candidatus Faecisoma merdavium]